LTSSDAPTVGDLFGGAITLLDLETTGADPSRDRITEIGLVEIGPDRPIGDAGEAWSSLVDPRQPIPAFISRLTGIDDRMVSGAPVFEALAPALAERLADRLLVAHNVRFDYAFLRAEFARAGIAFTVPVLCTARLSRRLYPREHRHNLDAVMARHGLACTARHRALGDAEVLGGFLAAATADLGAAAVRAAATHLMRPADAALGAADFALDVPEGAGCAILLDAQGRTLRAIVGARLRAEFMRQLSRPGPAVRELLAATRRIECHPGAGALGASLARLRIERMRPPRAGSADEPLRESWRLAWTAGATPAFTLCEASARIEPPDAWFGDFPDEGTARRVLATLARAHRLCAPLLGLAGQPAGPCAAAREDRCARACPGAADGARPDRHDSRALAALGRLPMPPALPAGLHAWREGSVDSMTEIHLFEGSTYLGSGATLADLHALRARREGALAGDRRPARLLESALRAGESTLSRVALPPRFGQPVDPHEPQAVAGA